MAQFGMSVNQASSDLTLYIGLAPHNMDYDCSLRTYVHQPGFKPMFDKLDAGRYLAQVRSVADGILDHDDCWIAGLPACDSAPTPPRGVDPATVRSVVDAIRRSEVIEVQYQSLSHPEPRWRWIAPHAIAFDGFRWHARAFCVCDAAFKDFLLSRIRNVRNTRESHVRAETYQDWHTTVTLEIAPHPALSETQAKVIALDYGMKNGMAELKVRRALLYYALRRLGLDTDPAARKPYDQQIVFVNRDAILGRQDQAGEQ